MLGRMVGHREPALEVEFYAHGDLLEGGPQEWQIRHLDGSRADAIASGLCEFLAAVRDRRIVVEGRQRVSALDRKATMPLAAYFVKGLAMPVYARPSLASTKVGSLAPGQQVRGEEVDGWLHLDEASSKRALEGIWRQRAH